MAIRVVDYWGNDVPSTINPDYNYTSVGTAYTWTVISDGYWQLYQTSSEVGWLEPNIIQGYSGASFTITFKKIPSYGSYTTTLNFQDAYGYTYKSVTLTLTSPAEPPFSLSVTDRYGSAIGSSVSFANTDTVGTKWSWTVKSSGEWWCAVDARPSGWLEFTPTHGYSGDTSVSVTLKQIPTTSSYSATLYFNDGGRIFKEITISMEPPPFSFQLVDSSGNSIPSSVSFLETDAIDSSWIWTVKANKSWTCTEVTSNTGWLAINPTSGSSGNTYFAVVLKRKPTSGTYSSQLQFAGPDGTVAKIVTVSITVVPFSISILNGSGNDIGNSAEFISNSAIGTKQTWTVRANKSWTCAATHNPSGWLDVSATSGSSGDTSFSVTLKQKPARATGGTYSSQLKFSGPDGVVAKTLTVSIVVQKFTIQITEDSTEIQSTYTYEESAIVNASRALKAIASSPWTCTVTSETGSPQNWVTVSPSSGGYGETYLYLTLNAKPPTSSGGTYKSYLKFFDSDGALAKTITISITVAKVYSFQLLDANGSSVGNSLQFSPDDAVGTKWIWTVRTNDPWGCAVNSNHSGWIEISPTTGNGGDTSFSVTLKQKPDSGSYSSTLYFTHNKTDVVKEVVVSINAPEPYLTFSGEYITDNTLNLPSTAEVNNLYSFTVSSNKSWRMTSPSEWFTIIAGSGNAGDTTATIQITAVPDGDVFSSYIAFYIGDTIIKILTPYLRKDEKPYVPPGDHFPPVPDGQRRTYYTWTSEENTSSLFTAQQYSLSGTAVPDGAVVQNVMAYVYVRIGGSTSVNYTMRLTQLSIEGGPNCESQPSRNMTASQQPQDIPETGYAALTGTDEQMVVFANNAITVNLRGSGGTQDSSNPTKIWVRGIYFAVDYLPVGITWPSNPVAQVYSADRSKGYIYWQPVETVGGSGSVEYLFKDEGGNTHPVIATGNPVYCIFVPEAYDTEKMYTITAMYSGVASTKEVSLTVYGSITEPANLKVTRLENGKAKAVWDNSEVEWGGGSIRYELSFYKDSESYSKTNVSSGYLIEEKLADGQWRFTLTAVYSGNESIRRSITFTYKSSNSSTVKVYNGAEWISCTVHVYDGTKWIECTPYCWNGSAWEPCSFT